jgi:ATP-dependent DNA helicase RecQ
MGLIMDKYEVLGKYFGYTGFRIGQAELIDNIISGKDALGIMPTGAGKSLCFQVPALILDGVTLVISPLVSLMKDQVDALVTASVPAAYINSTLNQSQTYKVIDNARNGAYKIIYVAPERLDAQSFLDFALNMNISAVTVDEAHCVSQWGQDFRPSYLKIYEFIEKLPKRPIISCFTATATREVREDIIKLMRLDKPYVVTTGYNRANLYFEVQKPRDKYGAVHKYLKNNPAQSGIIYCLTRKTVEEVCENLITDGFKAAKYHAGMSERERTASQDAFLYDRVNIMVATNAFGMGIDKSNVSYVIHYNMPKNIENYYQEAGRAGRDGSTAECILLYGGKDVTTNQFLIDNIENNGLDPGELEIIKERERERLKRMTFYCHSNDCLRAYILRYFGEKSENYCGNCGNCLGDYDELDITEDAQKILSAVYRMKSRYGINVIIWHLRGSKAERIIKLRLDKIPTYGIMKSDSEQKIRDIINHLVSKEYLELTDSEFPVVRLTGKSREVLFDGAAITMKTAKSKLSYSVPETAPKNKSSEKTPQTGPQKNIDNNLFAKLRELRGKLAAGQSVPAYIVFSDATLADMCRKLPFNETELLEVSGVGQTKLERYGREFLGVIKEYHGQ